MSVVQVELSVGLTLSLITSVGLVLSTAQHAAWLQRLQLALLGAFTAATMFTAHAGLVALVIWHGAFASTDQTILDWMIGRRAAVLNFVMVKISNVGSPVAMVALTVLSAGLLLLAKRPRDALMLLAAGIGARLSLDMWKEVYGRPRPSVASQLVVEAGFGLPSAHALNSIAVLGALAVVLTQLLKSTQHRVLKSTWLRVIVIAGAATDVFLIGVSRLYIGVHWFTDVLTGWLLGGAWLILCLSIRYSFARWPSAPPQSAIAAAATGAAGISILHTLQVAVPTQCDGRQDDTSHANHAMTRETTTGLVPDPRTANTLELPAKPRHAMRRHVADDYAADPSQGANGP